MRQPMSALGQKRTFAPQNVMSALPPKADMCSALAHVRFVPNSCTAASCRCLDVAGANGGARKSELHALDQRVDGGDHDQRQQRR